MGQALMKQAFTLLGLAEKFLPFWMRLGISAIRWIGRIRLQAD